MLVSWIATAADEPDARVLAWADATGCAAWILAIWDDEPLSHAATWNSEADRDSFETALEEWTEYLDRLGARHVTEGAVVLHRRSGVRATARVDKVEPDDLEDAGDQVERAFEARARLGELDEEEALLDARLEVVMPLTLERELEPADGPVEEGSAWVRLAAGTHSAVETTHAAIEFLPLLDGETPLRSLVDGRSSDDALELVRELLELGALRFVP